VIKVLSGFIYAQDTLEEATALLTELENYTDMDTNGNSVAEADSKAEDTESTQQENTDTQMGSTEDEKPTKTEGDNSWTTQGYISVNAAGVIRLDVLKPQGVLYFERIGSERTSIDYCFADLEVHVYGSSWRLKGESLRSVNKMTVWTQIDCFGQGNR